MVFGVLVVDFAAGLVTIGVVAMGGDDDVDAVAEEVVLAAVADG